MPRIGALARKVLQEIRASYWFVPTLLASAAALLAWAAYALQPMLRDWLPFRDLDVEGARNILTVIAQSMIGVAGVMFSLTLVAVTHAAGKYGPRLIGNFMRDRGNQWALGILIGVFVYALVTLILVDGAPEDRLRLPVVVAIALAFVGVATIIFFVHHVPETMNVSNIAAGLGHRLAAMLRDEIEAGEAGDGPDYPLPEREPDRRMGPDAAGYVQTMAFGALQEFAEENDLRIRLDALPGDFVYPERPILQLWGRADPDMAREVLRRALALGEEPTESQTLTFLADQLVEMTGIALSPGVNDPFTAMSCLNWLSAAIAVALTHEGGLIGQSGGRVHRPRLDFPAFYGHTFPAALPYVLDDRMTTAHLVALLEDLLELETAIDRRDLLADLRTAREALAR